MIDPVRPGGHGARGLAPTSALPLAYFATAHTALALALVVLVVQPGLPGTMFYPAISPDAPSLCAPPR